MESQQLESTFAKGERLFFTSDWHIRHQKLVTIGERPPNFEEKIRESMFSQTSPGDTVIHLGDLFMGRTSEMVGTLRSFIPEGVRFVNIRGNHDNYSAKKFRDCGIINLESFALDGIFFSHHGVESLPEGTWTQVFGHYHLAPKPEGFKGLRFSLEEEDYRLVDYTELAFRLISQALQP